jgi:uncharacterized protein YacL
MNCYISGIAGLALLGASISTMSVNKQQQNVLKSVLSDELDKKYESIVIERRNHYIMGLVLGMVISFIVVNKVKSSNYFTRLSLFTMITLVTAVIFYMLMPKSDYMLNHLKTEQENKQWLQVYKTMQSRYFIGLVLGALAAIPIANIMC